MVEKSDKIKEVELNTETEPVKELETEVNQESNLGAVIKKSVADVTETIKKTGKEKGADIKKDIESVAEAIKSTNKGADIKTNIENVAETVKKTGILEKIWVIWATLFVLPPAGIYLLWKKKPYPFKTNLLISVISGIWLIYFIGGMTSSDIDVSEYFPDRNMVKVMSYYNKNNG